MHLGRVIICLISAMFFSTRVSLAQPSVTKDTCTLLSDSIELSLKLIASENAQAIGDNSVPRATLSELKINSHLLLINMHMQLMRDNGCPKRKEPVRTGTYLLPALQCQNQMLAMRLGREVPKEEGSSLPVGCDMSKWQPNSEAQPTEPAATP